MMKSSPLLVVVAFSMTSAMTSASTRFLLPDGASIRGADTLTLSKVGRKTKELTLVSNMGRPMERLPTIERALTPGAAVISVWAEKGGHHIEVFEAVDESWALVEQLRAKDPSLATMRPLLEAPIPPRLRALALSELSAANGLDAEQIRSLVCDGWRAELTEFAVRYAGRHRITAAFECIDNRLDDPRTVGSVVDALGSLGPEYGAFAAPLLARIVESTAPPSIRASAVIGLGRVGDHDAIDALEQLALGGGEDIAVAAVVALGALEAKASLTKVAMKHEHPYVRGLARQHLEKGQSS